MSIFRFLDKFGRCIVVLRVILAVMYLTICRKDYLNIFAGFKNRRKAVKKFNFSEKTFRKKIHSPVTVCVEAELIIYSC